MKKFVTDNPQTNVETLQNLAFVKDGEVWVRGASEEGEDCKLVDLAKRACNGCFSKAEIENIKDVDGIGEFYLDCSMDGYPVATLYITAVQAAELREYLRAYENGIDKFIKDCEQDES